MDNNPVMSVKTIEPQELKKRAGDGLIIRGCGGPLNEWVDGINDMLTEAGILKNGTRFTNCEAFEHRGLTCLLFPFTDDVRFDVGKLTLWRLRTLENFGGHGFRILCPTSSAVLSRKQRMRQTKKGSF